jgi:cell division protease FtsH
MVTRLGMSEKLGPLTYGRRRQLGFLGVSGEEERNYSESAARTIDSKTRSLIEEGRRRAVKILTARCAALFALAAALEEREVMDLAPGEQVLREYSVRREQLSSSHA